MSNCPPEALAYRDTDASSPSSGNTLERAHDPDRKVLEACVLKCSRKSAHELGSDCRRLCAARKRPSTLRTQEILKSEFEGSKADLYLYVLALDLDQAGTRSTRPPAQREAGEQHAPTVNSSSVAVARIPEKKIFVNQTQDMHRKMSMKGVIQRRSKELTIDSG